MGLLMGPEMPPSRDKLDHPHGCWTARCATNPMDGRPLGPFERLSERADESQLRVTLRICVKNRYADL